MDFEELKVAISLAVEDGDVAKVRQFLTEHPDMVQLDFGMGTWLHMAAMEDSMPMVEMLLELGCEVDAQMDNSTRNTPLSDAITKAKPAIAKVLLEHGADPDHNRHIIGAAYASKHSLELVKLLDENGADIHAVFDFHSDPPTKINALSTAIEYGHDDVEQSTLR